MNLDKKDNLTKAYSYIIEYYNGKKDAANAKQFANGLYNLATSQALKDGGVKDGAAIEPYKKYIELIGVNLDKKDNLTKAYSYIIEYYNGKNDAANATQFAKQLLSVDPANTYAKQTTDEFKNGANPKPGATKPSDGKTPEKKK